MRFLSFWAVHAAGQEGGRSGREEDSFLGNAPLLEDTSGLVFLTAVLLSLTHWCLLEFCAAAVRRMTNKKKQKTELLAAPFCDTKWWKGHRAMETASRKKKKRKLKKSKLVIFCRKAVCVYCVNLTDRCFYHHSLCSGFEQLFTFCPVSLYVWFFSLYRPSFTVQEKKKLDADSLDWISVWMRRAGFQKEQFVHIWVHFPH